MSDLIARLEAAGAGSRDLDAEIAATFHIPPDNSPEWLGGWPGPFRARADGRVEAVHSDGKGGVHWLAPTFTTSLDVALSLVPEGWTVARINQNDDKSWATELRERFLTSYGRVVFGPANHKSPTPALALCSAALRARAPAPGERE